MIATAVILAPTVTLCARVSSLSWMKQKPFCSQYCWMLIYPGPTARFFCGRIGNYDPPWPPPRSGLLFYFRMCGSGFPRTHSKRRIGTDDLATFQVNVWTWFIIGRCAERMSSASQGRTGRYLPQCVSLVSGQHLEWRKTIVLVVDVQV